jgi:outer membrane lipoprotein-sorting protein
MRFKRVLTTGLLGLTPALTGCLTHTRTVLKTRPPDIVQTAALDQLLKQVDDRYKATQTATLYVEIAASTGGSREGKVTESLNFSGYIIIQNPDHVRVVLLVPFIKSRAMEMVSDGKEFKLVVPPKGCAIVGSDTSLPTQKGLYSLRPGVILDSLLIAPLQQDQDVSRTQDSRILEAPKTKTGFLTGSALRKELIQEPGYDIQFLSRPQNQVANTLRVLHIGRTDLMPYQQDIYNADGRIETQALYSNYQHFGDIVFPTKIVIQRPLDELGLTITVGKRTTFNQKLDADEFDLPIPRGLAVQNMDDPASAKSNPCVAHPAAPEPAPAASK